MASEVFLSASDWNHANTPNGCYGDTIAKSHGFLTGNEYESHGLGLGGRSVRYKKGLYAKASADIVLSWIQNGAMFTCLYFDEPDSAGHALV